jgi:5-methylcytosine-specific restriction endonuclease McrA
MTKLYKERLRGKANPHWKGGGITKICPLCNRTFVVAPSQAETRHYCSRVCAGIAKRKPKPIKTGHSYKKGEFQNHCKLCHISIPSNRVYCETCSPKGKCKITSYCEVCGKPIDHWRGYKRRFCSHTCRLKRFTTDGNPNWKGGRLTLAQRIRGCEKNRKLIASILKRDKYTCQNCGQVGGKLEVDHIKSFAEILEGFLQNYNILSIPEFEYELYLIALKYKPFWDKHNLQTLCKKCNWDKHLNNSQQQDRKGRRQPSPAGVD